MPVALRDVAVPNFGIPVDTPRIPSATYEKRCRAAYAKAGCDWLVVYADREHLANIAFLSGFEPRFEEALLLLGPAASAAVWRIVEGTQLGISELEAASAMGYAGEALTAHVMYATGDASHSVIGMRSPDSRIVKHGDGVTTAIGYWGGLSARAGLVTDHDEDFLKIAGAYFEGLIAWYETADIGVAGQTIFEAVTAALTRGGLRSALNPGQLTGHDEWIHTPVRPASLDRISSGTPFQVDIIPTPLPTGWALNCEDGIAFADAALRAELNARHPAVSERICQRRSKIASVGWRKNASTGRRRGP